MQTKSLVKFWRKEREAYDLCPFWDMCRAEDQKLVENDKGMEPPRRRNPLPGYVGKNYLGVMVIAQNPAPTPPHSQWSHRDPLLFGALDKAAKRGTTTFRETVQRVMSREIPDWGPLSNMGFPDWGVSIEEIAYLNLVKCATQNKAGKREGAYPGTRVRNRCMETYLCQHLAILRPHLIVFRYIGVEKTLRSFLDSRVPLDPLFRELSRWFKKDVRIVKFQGIGVAGVDLRRNIPAIRRIVSRIRKLDANSDV